MPEDLLDQGFQLAYFILPSRPVAIRVLTGALNKLKAQHGRENRRSYWRDKYLKRGITRISRQEADALQWLILFESDRFEREQEESNGPSYEAMAIRYVKILVRMTTAMSSFYVNIGLYRLLHNYSTADAQRSYETVTERYLGADEYRRAKAVLMDKLQRRFGRYLKTFRTQHGELRFEAWENQERWADLVGSCLTLFIPWSTRQSCPVSADTSANESAASAKLPLPAADGSNPDQMEIKRCHTFIDPVCNARLAHALAIDPPGRKLALPRFFMDKTKPEIRSDPPPERLTAQEREAINLSLSTEAARRRKASADVLKVMVDGVELLRLDRAQANQGSFEIEEGAELIEIRTDHDGEEIVLATNRVVYGLAPGIAASATTILLGGGRQLDLSISPAAPLPDGPRTAVVNLDLRTNPAAASLNMLAWRPALKYAFAALALVALGWMLGSRMTNTQRGQAVSSGQPMGFSATSPAPVSTSSTPVAITQTPQLVASYALTPDELAVRGAGGPDVPSIVLPPGPGLVELQLPVAREDLHKLFRVDLKPFLANAEILRETPLHAKATASGAMIRFWVPTALLEANQDYAIDLRSWSSPGRLEEVGRYTFHTVSK